MFQKLARVLALVTASAFFVALSGTGPDVVSGQAQAMQPGKGKTVRPMGVGRPDHQIIYEALFIGLEKLGYTVGEMQIGTYPTIHLSLGQGDADFTAVHWDGLHKAYYDKSGGDDTLMKLGPMYTEAMQAYYIDMATAKKHNITKMAQMKDPAIAKLFDSDGDGKANMTGCNPGWGCEKVIEHHLSAYKMRDHINHDKGQYFALMADTIARMKEGKPVFFTVWAPNWILAVMRPGDNVSMVSVPFSSLPGKKDVNTELPDGRNPGFAANNNFVLVNKEFAAANPAAAKFFELFRFPIPELSAAMKRMSDEGKDSAKLKAIAADWVKANQAKFDGWVAEAAKAGG